MSNHHAQQLIAYQRENRDPRAVGSGDIREPALLVELLTIILQDHLERTAPAGEPESLVPTYSGYVKLPAQPPPRWRPEDCDETACELATLIGHLCDITSQSKAA